MKRRPVEGSISGGRIGEPAPDRGDAAEMLKVQTQWMEDFKPLARAARIYWGAGSVIATLAFAAVLIPLSFLENEAAGWAMLVLLAAAAGVGWWITGRRWSSWGYAERERDLLIRRGVLVRRLVVVPYGRMQFVEVRQGPLDRLFGLASVRLHTAAAATDAQIPLLTESEADRLRERLTELGEAYAAGL